MHIFSICFFIFITIFAQSAPIPFVDENDLTNSRRAMIQTHTGFDQTEIHAVLPRLKKFRLKIQKIENEELVGPEFFIDPALEERDPTKTLHQKINIFHIDHLQPKSEYHLELIEVGTTSLLTTDRRRFRTLDPSKNDVTFTAASCLCDEDRYNETKAPIWTQKRLTKPDFMFLLGDITYVDSFDVVNKPEITTQDIWQRYFDSFLDNPMTREYRMTPILSTWDDHDSSNNANKYTTTLKESLRVFNLIYGGRSIPNIIENGHDGTYKWLTYGNTNFAFLDARTFREKYDTDETGPQRYGHLGQIQEEWLFKKLEANHKPLVLIKGDMWGSSLITEDQPQTGTVKRITESFFSDHPFNYAEFMKRLQVLPIPYIFISGDIHRAQFIKHGPQQKGARWNPFVTAEWTTSPLYSFRYNPDDPEAPPWPDVDRYAHKNIYNFGLFKVQPGKTEVKFSAQIKGDGRKNKDGSDRDWRTLAEPVLTDSLILKAHYPIISRSQNLSCIHFYK